MLTPRQQRVLQLMSEPGATCESVAEDVGLMPQAVRFIVRKLVREGRVEKHGRFRTDVPFLRGLLDDDGPAADRPLPGANRRRPLRRERSTDLARAWALLDPDDQRELGVAALKMFRHGMLPAGLIGTDVADVVAVALPGLFQEVNHA